MKSTSETFISGKNLEALPNDFWKNIPWKNSKSEYKHEPWVYLKKQVIQSHLQHPDTADPSTYIECQLCGFRGRELTKHLAKHGVKTSDYGITKCEEIRNKIGKRMAGDKNPAYQHGGKYSPFSSNFIKYKNGEASYTKEEIFKKKEQTVKENPQNNSTRIEYYLKQGLTEKEAKEALANRQATFTKEKCVEKYGDVEGERIWRERQERWQATLNSKTPEEVAEINRKKNPLFWKCDETTPGIFYIITTPHGVKVGITKNSLGSRYGRYINSCKVILTHKDSYKRCAMLEFLMKASEQLKPFRYKGIRFEGWTETFTCDSQKVVECYNNLKENFENEFKEKFPNLQHNIP